MSQSLVVRYDERIAGVLSCYDRVVITGTLPGVCDAEGMTRFLHADGVRIFDILGSRGGEGTIEPIGKVHIREEDIVARVLEQRGDCPGLVHILSATEACDAYKPWHD